MLWQLFLIIITLWLGYVRSETYIWNRHKRELFKKLNEATKILPVIGISHIFLVSDKGGQYAMMSMKTVIANLVQQYRILPSDNIQIYDPEKPAVRLPLRVQYSMMMKHVDNFEIKLELRS
ncbi:uncharacterized protein LOC131854309 [Achroia grisella]|uniref:uncharacterized protein LOC131854309 n=1 Tax=Achroia grisella TaxID=688607 RepID=UPI0027D250CD|nr:uncharacterized protein LOC131854309 [Achroia grisella]